MKLYVPEIGDSLKLTSDWSFPLYAESRNLTLGALKGYSLYYSDKFNTMNWLNMDSKPQPSIEITIPAGTILKVDRIYIRKGISEYSSITFILNNFGSSEIKSRYSERVVKYKTQRFWAKLSDCNQIEFEKVEIAK